MKIKTIEQFIVYNDKSIGFDVYAYKIEGDFADRKHINTFSSYEDANKYANQRQDADRSNLIYEYAYLIELPKTDVENYEHKL